jgi:hypothetical protein
VARLGRGGLRDDGEQRAAGTDGVAGAGGSRFDRGIGDGHHSYPASLRRGAADSRHCWGGWPHGIACQTWAVKPPRPEPPMTQFSRTGLDTSKAVFALHCADETGKPLLRELATGGRRRTRLG